MQVIGVPSLETLLDLNGEVMLIGDGRGEPYVWCNSLESFAKLLSPKKPGVGETDRPNAPHFNETDLSLELPLQPV